MYLETLGFFGILSILLFYFAENWKHPALGIIGSLLVILLSIYVLTDAVQIQTGETITLNEVHSAIEAGTNIGDSNMTAYWLEDLTNETLPEYQGQENTTNYFNLLGSVNTTVTGTQTKAYVYSDITLPATLIFGFSELLALFLALCGIYGVFTYGVRCM